MSQKKTPEELKEVARFGHIKRTYGLDAEQYQELYDAQEGNCAICTRHETTFSRRLSIDHDHVDGTVRGLLCTFCNSRVVGRHRDPELFRRAYEYLSAPRRGWVVPPKKKKARAKRVRRKA